MIDTRSIIEEYYSKPENMRSKIHYRCLLQKQLRSMNITLEEDARIKQPLLQSTSWEESEAIAKSLLKELEP